MQDWIKNEKIIAGIATAAALVLILSMIGIFLWSPWKSSASEVIHKAEDFVTKELIDSWGLIESFPFRAEKIEHRPEYEREALSESAGLWLQITQNLDQQKMFDQQYEAVNKYFLLDNETLSWKLLIGPEDQITPDPYSATIDDLRVARALLAAFQKWGKEEYKNLALKLAEAMRDNAVYHDFLLHKPMSKEEQQYGPFIIDLSYLDLKAMKMLIPYDPDWQIVYERSLSVLLKGMRSNGFFYDKYDVQNNRYYDQDKNMINALISAINLAEVGFSVDNFMQFLQKEWVEHGKLFGRYNPETGEKAVDYESLAVYGLAMRLALTVGDQKFAEAIRNRIMELAKKQTKSLWKGALCDDECHAFDHLQALLAFAVEGEMIK